MTLLIVLELTKFNLILLQLSFFGNIVTRSRNGILKEYFMSSKNMDFDAKKVWEETLGILKTMVSPSTFEPWIMPLSPVLEGEEHYKKDSFVLKSNLSFGVSHLNQKYLPDIQKALNEALPLGLPVEIVFVPTDVKKAPKKKEKPSEHIKLMQEQIDNLKQMHSFCALNLKYTFDNFVQGENSKVAYDVAKLISEAPGQKFNPLFITGSVGIGKTHLMQAIGHGILKNFPKMKVKYAKTEEFTNQLVDSCRKGMDSYSEMKKFRDQYRNIDVLLLDDIQFAEGKKRTEEEIFNTFDALFHAGKQIVFASDRPIETFEKTPDRLKSRYEWGLSVEIKPPSFETRVEIIKKHALRSNFEIKDEVAEFLAKNFAKNVRELEGAYNKVSAYASIQGLDLTLENAKEILGYKENAKKITTEDIIQKCAEHFGTTPDMIKGTQRSIEIKTARQFAIYLTREILDLSFPNIAQSFNKNHTTILYSYEKMKKDMQTDKAMREKIEELTNLIKE